MPFQQEKRNARRILAGLEDGTLRPAELRASVREADPTLIYFIVRWIRAHYPATHPAAEGVLGRLVELSADNPSLAAQLKEGGEDTIVDWFEDTYEYGDLPAGQFIDLIVEKLEG
jgi:hypothetical protein